MCFDKNRSYAMGGQTYSDTPEKAPEQTPAPVSTPEPTDQPAEAVAV